MDETAPSSRTTRTVGRWLFVVVASFALVFQQGDVTVSDGASMLAVDQGLVDHGTLSVPGDRGVPGRNDHYYSKYGVGLPLVALVPVAAASGVASVVGKRQELEKAAAASVMPFIAAGLALAVFLLARRLGSGARAACLVGIGSVAGTFVLPYAKDFFAEPLAALAVTMSLERTLARRPWASGAWLALAFLTRPQTLVALPFFLATLLWRRDWRAILEFSLPVGAAVSAYAEYNYARFGNVTKFGYQYGPGFSTPFFHGASGLLFSSEKSVFLFAPIVLVSPLALAALVRAGRAGRWEPPTVPEPLAGGGRSRTRTARAGSGACRDALPPPSHRRKHKEPLEGPCSSLRTQ